MPERSVPDSNIESNRTSLKFLPSSSREGFVSQAVSSDNIANPSEIVRELIQNSMDAGNEAGRKQIKIEFEITEIPIRDIPGIKEYKNALASAKKAHRENIDSAEAILERIDNQLNKDKISVLNILDNGIGLDSERMNSLLSDGMTSKIGLSSDSGGSYGVGHFTAFPASDLQYVLYGGVTETRNRTMSGHAILASHRSREHESPEETLGKDGYYIESQDKAEVKNSFTFATNDSVPQFVNRLLNNIERNYSSGSVVSILGFNNFKLEADPAIEIKKAIVRSFFIPIYDGKLLITCCNEEITPTVLDDEMKIHRSQKRRNARTDVINGNWAYGHYLTYKTAFPISVPVESGEIKLFLRDAEPDESTRIALYRQGMYISDQVPRNRPADFSKFQPFNAVIQAESMIDGFENSAFQLIRKAEGTKHLELNSSRLKQEFKEKFDTLFERIKLEIEKMSTQDAGKYFSPSVFQLDVGSLNFVNSKGKSNKKNVKPNHEGMLTPVDENSHSARSGNKTATKGKGKKSQQRQNTRTPCEIVASAKRDSQKLQLQIKSKIDIQNAHLSLHIHSGSDATCVYPLSDRNVRFHNNSNGTTGWDAGCLGRLSAGIPVLLSLDLTDSVPEDAVLKISVDDLKDMGED